MLDDHHTPLDAGGHGPLPYDTVLLHPGTVPGADPGPYVVADIAPAAGGQAWEINLPDDDPRYWDWAAIVTLGDIARITRLTPAGPVSWAPVR
jgi:hypothetical protein